MKVQRIRENGEMWRWGDGEKRMGRRNEGEKRIWEKGKGKRIRREIESEREEMGKQGKR